MLTQRLSWLVAPGRVLDLSRESSCWFVGFVVDPRQRRLRVRILILIRVRHAFGLFERTYDTSFQSTDDADAEGNTDLRTIQHVCACIAGRAWCLLFDHYAIAAWFRFPQCIRIFSRHEPAIRPLPALPPSTPSCEHDTASLLSVDEAPLGSAGAPVRDPVEENSCLGDRTVNVLAPPRDGFQIRTYLAMGPRLIPSYSRQRRRQRHRSRRLHYTPPRPHPPLRPSSPPRLELELGLDTAIPDHTVQAVAARPAEQEKTPTVSGLAQVWRSPMLVVLCPADDRAHQERGTVYEEWKCGERGQYHHHRGPHIARPQCKQRTKTRKHNDGMFRSPSPSSGPGAVGMRKAASAGAGPIVSAASNDLSSSAAGSSTETPALSCDKQMHWLSLPNL
ncbi:hypothetical protein RHS01_09198 [Rhizoctonia solani]|uniref:Uncharacterized protein n=1 Tax=Rhizoctonia solani TaxID=456999 RepID=A0A8H7M3U7_9AGAM|nr:hypothetical protein RHS01_09198 [Rhizoctonia solani]